MIALLIAVTVGFGLSFVAMPPVIRALRRNDVGQFIQEDVAGHSHKRGTPTMGGSVILVAAVLGYLVAHLRIWSPEQGFGLDPRPFSAEAGLALLAFIGMGVIGFIDDYQKYARKENLGLSKRWKFGGQLLVAGLFAWGAVAAGVSTELSFTREIGFDLGWAYPLWVLFLLTATANAVNLTDGLDGLAAGSSALVFGAFVIIGFWQFRNPAVYSVDGALDLGILAAALLGSVMGFLWYNAAPAELFMGDVGSQALGGAMAALALLTNTHLLLAVLGGLYLMVTVSVILQVASFRLFGRRIFRMAPIHHHFELGGWPETTVIIRFWIIAGICVALGLGIFYGDFISMEGGLS
ncbi:MAG: phospho-N-acetylmuramoyl-pentapeptide-transferase [Acidimicrobiia bacterium]|nr:phospho-N-acetylmuramoyl-pentapeptide-transferase [Acidimicrobiia bacterium]NNF11223.1 phospho-N-acetylmuramoyl-pentapeptide-transferase [Acidimicrobiia bacterium]NNL68959.1 phospho-N-acetylmuramoyl-pentapeptide-transferase [Acidimicrobiia bacterium]